MYSCPDMHAYCIDQHTIPSANINYNIALSIIMIGLAHYVLCISIRCKYVYTHAII